MFYDLVIQLYAKKSCQPNSNIPDEFFHHAWSFEAEKIFGHDVVDTLTSIFLFFFILSKYMFTI